MWLTSADTICQYYNKILCGNITQSTCMTFRARCLRPPGVTSGRAVGSWEPLAVEAPVRPAVEVLPELRTTADLDSPGLGTRQGSVTATAPSEIAVCIGGDVALPSLGSVSRFPWYSRQSCRG